MDELGGRVQVLKALGDTTRLRLLIALRRGELTVAELTKIVKMSQPRVSHHLKLLHEAGLVRRSPDQNEVLYGYNAPNSSYAFVERALDLPANDSLIRGDLRRLEEILEQRQDRARDLLRKAGVAQLPDESLESLKRELDSIVDDHLHRTELGDMLDIGTGLGTMLRLLGRRARRVVGIDSSRDMRVVSRAVALSEGLSDSYIRSDDMYALSFDRGTFDFVTTDRVLGVAESPRALLAEAIRVLRPHGAVLVLETEGSGVGEEQLAEWFAELGFSCLESRRLAEHGVLIAIAARRVARPPPPV